MLASLRLVALVSLIGVHCVSARPDDQLTAMKRVLPILEAYAGSGPKEIQAIQHLTTEDWLNSGDLQSVYLYFVTRKNSRTKKIVKFSRIGALRSAILDSYPYINMGNQMYIGGDPTYYDGGSYYGGQNNYVSHLIARYQHYRGKVDNWEKFAKGPALKFMQACLCEGVEMTGEIVRAAGKDNRERALQTIDEDGGESDFLKMIEERAAYEGNTPILILNKILPIEKDYSTPEGLNAVKTECGMQLSPVQHRIRCPPPPKPSKGAKNKKHLAIEAPPAPRSGSGYTGYKNSYDQAIVPVNAWHNYEYQPQYESNDNWELVPSSYY